MELLSSQNNERELARNWSKGLNSVSQDSFINSKLLLATIMIDERNEDTDTAINTINDGKHGIVHPQILTPATLKATIQEFEEKRRTRFHFDSDESKYQHIIDISQLSVAITKGLLSYVSKIPIIDKEEGQIKRIIPFPHLVQTYTFPLSRTTTI